MIFFGFLIALKGRLNGIIIDQCNSIYVENTTKQTIWGTVAISPTKEKSKITKKGQQNVKKKENIKAGQNTLNRIRLFKNGLLPTWYLKYSIFWYQHYLWDKQSRAKSTSEQCFNYRGWWALKISILNTISYLWSFWVKVPLSITLFEKQHQIRNIPLIGILQSNDEDFFWLAYKVVNTKW